MKENNEAIDQFINAVTEMIEYGVKMQYELQYCNSREYNQIKLEKFEPSIERVRILFNELTKKIA